MTAKAIAAWLEGECKKWKRRGKAVYWNRKGEGGSWSMVEIVKVEIRKGLGVWIMDSGGTWVLFDFLEGDYIAERGEL